MKYFTIVLSAIFFTACASTHPGYKGKAANTASSAEIIVSANRVGAYSDPTNAFYGLVIENKSSEWLKISNVEVSFPNNEDVPHQILTGNEINAWAKSYAIKARRESHNANLGVAGLILGGLVLMVAAAGGGSGAGDLAKVGAGASMAGVGVEAGREVAVSKRTAENSEMVPENYIFTGVEIPSSGLAEKWLIVHLPQKRIAKKMSVRLHTHAGIYEYLVPTGKYGQDNVGPSTSGGLTQAEVAASTVATNRL